MKLTNYSLAASLLLLSQSGKVDSSSSSFASSSERIDGTDSRVIFEEKVEYDEIDDSLLFSVGGEVLQEFESWVEKFQKKYKCTQEKFERMKIWIKNHLLIEAHNQQEPAPSFTMGHNPYSDMTHEEFRKMFSLGEFSAGVPESLSSKFAEEVPCDENADTPGLRAIQRRMEAESEETSDLADSIDWREKDAVTSVKNQGHCGSCWAFSAIGAIEGVMGVNKMPLVNLSVQELVDCDKTDMNCMGGLMDKAFLYEEGTNGLCSWDDYPYDSPHIDGVYTCKMKNCTPVEGSEITGFEDVGHTDKALMTRLNKQPVSVAIQANQLAFQFYKKGVFDAECGTNLDHGVLAVGYGTEEGEDDEDGKDYYIIKNSWGEKWGDEGYMKLVRGLKTDISGHCGVLKMPSVPEENTSS